MVGNMLWKQYWWLIIILIIGVVIVCLLGWAWAFLWEWGNKNTLLGFTAPVNNSVWEMTKIFIYPFLIFFIVLYACAYHTLQNPAVALLCATVGAIFFMWFWFYVYTWFNPSKSNLGANIAIWVLAVILAMVILLFIFTAPYMGDVANYTCIAIYLLLIVLWCIFTYSPPCNCGMWWHDRGFTHGGSSNDNKKNKPNKRDQNKDDCNRDGKGKKKHSSSDSENSSDNGRHKRHFSSSSSSSSS